MWLVCLFKLYPQSYKFRLCLPSASAYHCDSCAVVEHSRIIIIIIYTIRLTWQKVWKERHGHGGALHKAKQKRPKCHKVKNQKAKISWGQKSKGQKLIRPRNHKAKSQKAKRWKGQKIKRPHFYKAKYLHSARNIAGVVSWFTYISNTPAMVSMIGVVCMR